MDRQFREILRTTMLIIASIATIVLVGCDDQHAAPEVPTKVPARKEVAAGKIVALGDSLTAGLGVTLEDSYPAQLEKKLRENGLQYRVVNGGVSGETSSGTLSRLDWILAQKPDIVILEIGANDGLRGIDTSLVEENIDKILTKLTERGVTTVLAGMKMVWNLGEEYTATFNAIYPRLVSKHKVIFMPFFLEDVASVPSLNRADTIHPNEKGYQRIVDNIYPYVIKAIEVQKKKKEEN